MVSFLVLDLSFKHGNTMLYEHAYQRVLRWIQIYCRPDFMRACACH